MTALNIVELIIFPVQHTKHPIIDPNQSDNEPKNVQLQMNEELIIRIIDNFRQNKSKNQ